MSDGISGYFAAPYWEPLCAVGSHGDGRVNAQICVSVYNASIVPDLPRLFVVLWNPNYTCTLAKQSGSLAVTLLSGEQLELVEPLGIRSGHEGDKLGGLRYELTASGNPWFPGGVGYADCDVRQMFELGDATLFICSVRKEERTGGAEPLTWSQAQKLLDLRVLDAYKRKFAGDVERARADMQRWLR